MLIWSKLTQLQIISSNHLPTIVQRVFRRWWKNLLDPVSFFESDNTIDILDIKVFIVNQLISPWQSSLLTDIQTYWKVVGKEFI